MPARRSESHPGGYELRQSPAPAHQPFDSLRWSHPTKNSQSRRMTKAVFLNGLLSSRRQTTPAERSLFAASVLEVERSEVVDLEQVAEVRPNVFFEKSRRTVLTFFVGVPSENDEFRTGSSDSCECLKNCVDADVSTDAVKTASVEDERECFVRPVDRTNVAASPSNFDASTFGLRLGLFNRERRQINSRHFEAELSKQDGIRAGTAAEFQDAARLDARLVDDTSKFCRRQSAVPRRAARFVTLIPMLSTIHLVLRCSSQLFQLCGERDVMVLRLLRICSDTCRYSKLHNRN